MIFSYNQPTGSPAALLFRTANGDSRGGEHLWKCLSDVESLKLHNGNICFTVYRKPRYLMAKIKKNIWFPVNIFPTKPIHWIRVPWLDMISHALIWGSEMFKTFSGNQGWSLRCTIINHRQESSTSSVANIHPTFNGAHSPCDFHLGQCGHRSKYPRKRLLQHKLENMFRPKSG